MPPIAGMGAFGGPNDPVTDGSQGTFDVLHLKSGRGRFAHVLAVEQLTEREVKNRQGGTN